MKAPADGIRLSGWRITVRFFNRNNPHRSHPLAEEAKFTRRSTGQVDEFKTAFRAAIIDGHYHRPVIGEIHDLYLCAKGNIRMSCRQLFLVIDHAGTGSSAIVTFFVVSSFPYDAFRRFHRIFRHASASASADEAFCCSDTFKSGIFVSSAWSGIAVTRRTIPQKTAKSTNCLCRFEINIHTSFKCKHFFYNRTSSMSVGLS